MIVEGGSFEPKVLNNIQRCFFSDKTESEYVIITLPVNDNIYVLWKILREDEDLDIIEVVREQSSYARNKLEGLERDSFSEIYLFFDFDTHQNNLRSDEDPDIIIQSMIDLFDNETENGKLYISYPMAEAIRDMIPGSCKTFSDKCYYMKSGKEYKAMTGLNNPLVHIGTYSKDTWGDIINIYRGRVSCLFNNDKLMQIEECKNITEHQLYDMQKNKIDEGIGAGVISAFPRMIMDYYDADYIGEMINCKTIEYTRCNERDVASSCKS